MSGTLTLKAADLPSCGTLNTSLASQTFRWGWSLRGGEERTSGNSIMSTSRCSGIWTISCTSSPVIVKGLQSCGGLAGMLAKLRGMLTWRSFLPQRKSGSREYLNTFLPLSPWQLTLTHDLTTFYHHHTSSCTKTEPANSIITYLLGNMEQDEGLHLILADFLPIMLAFAIPSGTKLSGQELSRGTTSVGHAQVCVW